jgi:hypothetical protein
MLSQLLSKSLCARKNRDLHGGEGFCNPCFSTDYADDVNLLGDNVNAIRKGTEALVAVMVV